MREVITLSVCFISSSLDKENMYSTISNDHEHGSKHGQTSDIRPQGLRVKAKAAEDGGPGNLNIQAVLVIGQGQILDLIDNKTLKPVMEYRKLLKSG